MASNSPAFMAVAAAALVAVSGATYAQYVAQIQQQNHGDATCTSFHYTSEGDPEIVSYNGGIKQNINRSESLPNFVTVENSAGGATTIGTQTTAFESAPWVSVNTGVTMTQKNWTITVGLSNPHAGGVIAASVKDASGTHTLVEGSKLSEPDGTVIAYQNGELSVGQRLSWGGSTLTEIKAYTHPGSNQSAIDLGIIGMGDAVVSGTAAQQGTGSASSMIYSCNAKTASHADVGYEFLDGSRYDYNGTGQHIFADASTNTSAGTASL